MPDATPQLLSKVEALAVEARQSAAASSFYKDLTREGGRSFLRVLETLSEEAKTQLAQEKTANWLQEVAWEKLHTGNWKEVCQVWRDAYTLACLLVAAAGMRSALVSNRHNHDLLKKAITGSLRELDMAVIMGGPLFRAQADAFIDLLQQVWAADYKGSSLLPSLEADVGKTPTLTPVEDEPLQKRRRVEASDILTPAMTVPLPPGSLENIDRLVAREAAPSLEHFWTHYMKAKEGAVPIVITGAIEHWPARERWQDLGYLKKVAGARTVPVEIGTHYLAEGWGQQLMPLADFIERYVLAERPDAGQPRAVQSGSRQSTGGESGCRQPGSEQIGMLAEMPEAGRPGPGQPGSRQPDVGQPGAGQPGSRQCNGGEPGGRQPGSEQIGVLAELPEAGQPSARQPGSRQPDCGEPGPGGQPGGRQPGSRRCDAGQPAITQTGSRQPNSGEPGGRYPGGRQPNGEEPGSDVEQPSATQPGSTPNSAEAGGRQPGGRQPNGKQPGSEQNRVEQSGMSGKQGECLDGKRQDLPGEPKRGYLAQHPLFEQIPVLRRDIEEPVYCCLGEGEVQSVNAWFGPPGTVTPLHHDPHHNLLAQVVGRKYIRLYTPAATASLAPFSHGQNTNSSQVDLDAPDYERFPQVRGLEFVECVLEPGEMLYIPPQWWHFVKALDVSFSVTFWWR